MKKLLYILFLLFLAQSSFAQKSEIDKIKAQQKKAKQEIAETAKLIKETERNQTATVQKLELLKQQIVLRERYLNNLTYEIQEIKKDIANSEIEASSLKVQLKQMQEEYKLILFTLYKVSNEYDQLIFILSADNFNQAYNRVKYLQYYSDFMIDKANEIKLFQDSLSKHIVEQTALKAEKEKLLVTEEEQRIQLSKDKNKQSNTLQDLQSRQQDLKEKLKQKQALANKLNKRIQELIAAATTTTTNTTPADKIISKNFYENKGRLPWPTPNGKITMKFGTQRHPTLPIDIDSRGIEITCTKGTKARAIFEGTVVQIVIIPGKNTAVLVKHGQYYTVYDNLINVSVKSGQKVKVKQDLGTIYTDNDTGLTVLQLQIWKEKQVLNPQPWLSK